MKLKSPIPTKNRAYTLAFLAMGGLTLLAMVTLWKNPNQYQYVFDWYGSQLLWLVPLVIGAKEVGKGVSNITKGYLTKHENGATKQINYPPPQTGKGDQ